MGFRDRSDPPDSIPSVGYVLALADDASAFRHRFCGAHDIAGTTCPNCDLPLTQMMSLDASDARLELTSLGVARVPLLFCWRCYLSRGFQYRLHVDGGIEIVHFERGTHGAGFPYEDYPTSFPAASFELVERSSPVDYAHQIGGNPTFLQGRPHEACRLCGSAMQFMALVVDDATLGATFAGNCGVQTLFLVCMQDGVIAATHELD